MLFLSSLALLAGIAAGSLLLGRALAGALGGGVLHRFTPLNAVASALVGTAIPLLVFGWLTEHGLPAPQILPVLLALFVLLLTVTALRGRLGTLRPRASVSSWALLLGPFALATTLGLLPGFAETGTGETTPSSIARSASGCRTTASTRRGRGSRRT